MKRFEITIWDAPISGEMVWKFYVETMTESGAEMIAKALIKSMGDKYFFSLEEA